MIETAVINFTKCSPRSTIASNRIAKFISETLDCPLIDNSNDATVLASKTVRHLFVVNGMYGFCDFRPEVERIVKGAGTVYWCANDYAIKAPKPIKSRGHIRLATFDNYDEHPASVYLNWNQLTFYGAMEPRVDPPMEGLTYYGAFRPGRADSFKRYLTGDLPYKARVFCSRPNISKFSDFGVRAVSDGGKIEPQVEGNNWAATIYIEDDESHRVYHSPANRFYEMLSAGTLILFCRSTLGTMRRAGFDVEPWAVSSPADVAAALARRDELLAAQRAALVPPGLDPRLHLRQEFVRFCRSMGVKTA